MTTYTWPTGDTAFIPRAITVTFVHSQLINTSPLNGATQSAGLPGGRLKVRLDFPRHSYAERARLEAFFRRLNGMQHRVSLWDLARAVPQGNWTPSGVTMGASASQFANSLTLAGCVGRNLVGYTQALDNAYWAKNNVTVGANTSAAPDGASTADSIVETAATGAHYLSRSLTMPTGVEYTMSAHAKVGSGTSWMQLGFFGGAHDTNAYANFNVNTGAVGSVGSSATAKSSSVGGGWYRFSITSTTVTAGTGGGWIGHTNNSGSAARAPSYLGVNTTYFYSWGPQLEVGPLTDYEPFAMATAGDWLQVPTSTGNQLVQVVADAIANDAGAMTVEVQPMLRGSVSSGAAVVLDKPSALFVLPDMEFSVPRGGSGICPEFSVDLYEVFA